MEFHLWPSRRRRTAPLITPSIDPRLRAAPPTVPLWVRPDAALGRQYLAPGTYVHIYESAWHRSLMRPHFPYTVPVVVTVDGPLGVGVRVGFTGHMHLLIHRESSWVIVPAECDCPPPYSPAA